MAKIFIRPDGTVEGLYTDQIPLTNLGFLNIARATHVEFCAARQEWVVTLPSGQEIFSHSSREKALDWERKYCEDLLLEGYRVEA